MSKTLFFIPARGGSKGIPGKNIKPLGGRPLICHSIDQARRLAPDADICLSTDSQEIADVALSYGLAVPFLRPERLAADDTPTRDAILWTLDEYRRRGTDYDTVVLLQPTSPFRTVADIRGAMDLYRPGIDMVVSVTAASTNPYYNAFESDEEGYLHISKGHGLYTRRQDAPRVWEYNGAVYVIRASSLREMPMGSFPRRLMYPMSADRSLDLDTPADWLMAEALIKSESGTASASGNRPGVVVYCSSASDLPADLEETAVGLGRAIGRLGCRLIYGGVNAGLMHKVALGASEAGAPVTGIVPEFFRHRADPLVTDLILTSDLNTRKARMIEEGDIFVVLPGGLGTIDEWVSTASQTMARRTEDSSYNKQIIVYNREGIFNQMAEQFNATNAGIFSRGRFADPGVMTHSAAELFEAFEKRVNDYRNMLSNI